MEDKELGYRVANFAVSTFNDATTSYFHRSVGGYHGAKLSRYDDLIRYQLQRGNPEAYDMLNTKYFIVDNDGVEGPEAVLNEGANGAAWFVGEIVVATSAQEEMSLLDEVNTDYTAIVSADYAARLSDVVLSDGEVELVKYKPNNLVYRTTSAEGGLCVFSEIYYDKGWKAYIDGREAEYIRVDWLLRGMVVPAGDHTIEWRFRAPMFDLVEGVTLCFSLVILGGLVAWVAVEAIKRRKKR